MSYQPRKSPRGTIRDYRRSFHEKSKDKKRSNRRLSKSLLEEKQLVTEKNISEGTLKRLHTLGGQKFGTSPFSEHFKRWLDNVEAVLNEFESFPGMSVDDQYLRERSQALSVIKLQLENRTHREASLEKEIRNLTYCKNHLKQINNEYLAKVGAIRSQKNNTTKRLNKIIEGLKKEHDRVIRMKTGFFRGVSSKQREQKEILIAELLNNKQQDLEVILLNFKSAQKQIRDDYEKKREPFLEQAKVFQKRIKSIEEDGSLEERWFACEALIDAVNSFLQRKSA